MSRALQFINSMAFERRAIFFEQLRQHTQTKITENSFRRQISGGQVLSAIVCACFETLSDGVVTRPDMRPNDWELAWPELRKKYHQLLQQRTSKVVCHDA